MSLATRNITLRFPRLHSGVECGQRAALHWNGTRASNGDGVAQGFEAELDMDDPLAGPVDLFPDRVKLGALMGQALMGAAMVGNGVQCGLGALEGPALVGQALQPAGFLSLAVPFMLRDGEYLFGAVMRDADGNVEPSPMEVAVTIAAPPRPARSMQIDEYDAGSDTLSVSWRGSPDLET